ncbi:disease resistance protein RPV1-like [Pyrus communis]|uniref:disease resistance protein RPV1-like n=1 Tax=Pyrus communis TaxID=23211 RepID=UPI0035BFAD55
MTTSRSTNATATSSSSSRRSNRWKYEVFKNSPLLFFFLCFSLFLKSVNTTSSAHVNRCKYEVFLSFRGVDTRKTFTDHLYSALSKTDIYTFVDYQLKRGENIQSELDREIEGSRIAVVIFSKRYAESRWCLRELSKIMRCREDQEGKVVYPIFYDVDPSQVRKQSGSFGEAFRKHERDEDPNEVEQWRKDLKACADLGGRNFNTTADGREGLFIQNVVGDIIALTKTREASQSSTLLEYLGAWARVPYSLFSFSFFLLFFPSSLALQPQTLSEKTISLQPLPTISSMASTTTAHSYPHRLAPRLDRRFRSPTNPGLDRHAAPSSSVSPIEDGSAESNAIFLVF